MREAKIVLIIILLVVLINAVKQDMEWRLPEVLPLLGGREPGLFDIAGILMIAIALNGYARLNRMRDRQRRYRRMLWTRRW